MNFSISNYVSSLIPKLTKKDLLNDIANVKSRLEQGLLNNYNAAKSLFESMPYKSQDVRKMNDTFTKKLSKKFQGNLVHGVEHVLSVMSLNCDEIQKIALRHIQADISTTGITYLKANLVRYVELMDFTTRYASVLLPVILFNESKANNYKTQNIPTKRDFDFVAKNYNNFLEALLIMSVGKADLERSLAAVPDVAIPEDETSKALVEKDLPGGGDPMGMRFLIDTATFNIAYHITNLLDSWAQNRYDRDVETAKMVELKIEDYRRAAENNPDPRLQEIIEGYEKRLAILESRIKAEENKYANS